MSESMDMTSAMPAVTIALTRSTQEEGQIEFMKMIAHGIIVPVICFIGMGLNLINFIVLKDKRLKESCYTYLVGLAVADFLSLLMFGVNSIGRGHYPEHTGWSRFETFVYFPICLIATAASVFLIVTVTAERFVFLYWPIQSRMWCTKPVARRIVAGTWILSLVLNFPRFFVFYVDSEGNMTRTKFGNSQGYKILTWILFFLIAVGCGVILIVFNALLIRGIHQANKRRQSLKSKREHAEKHEEIRLTRTLISVIFLYLIGEIPSSFFSRIVFGAILGRERQHLMNSLWYEACVAVATILVVSQHSLNFIFYCVFNKRFYAVFRSYLSCCREPCQEPLHSEIATVVNLSLDNSSYVDRNERGEKVADKQNGSAATNGQLSREDQAHENGDAVKTEQGDSEETGKKQTVVDSGVASVEPEKEKLLQDNTEH